MRNSNVMRARFALQFLHVDDLVMREAREREESAGADHPGFCAGAAAENPNHSHLPGKR